MSSSAPGGLSLPIFDKEGIEIAEWFNTIGISAGVLKYHTQQSYGALHDANRALEWTRTHATELNIDPTRIGMIGFSAGAHLTAIAAQKEPKQNFSIMIYPAYLQAQILHTRKKHHGERRHPTAFIAQAQDDKRYYRSALAYALALDEASVSTELHLYTRGGHGYGLRDLGRPAHQWTALCEACCTTKILFHPQTEIDMAKIRLDQLLVEQQLVQSREQAQRLIRAGHVRIKEQTVSKPGHLFPEEANST